MLSFFPYFGGKYGSALIYPKPQYDTIVEPFAGAAGYSLRYPKRKILLFDKSPVIVGVWNYLIKVSVREVMNLPDIKEGQTVDDFKIPQEAKWFIGFHLYPGKGRSGDKSMTWRKLTAWSHWDAKKRSKLAHQLDRIRHWKVEQRSFDDVPNVHGTWFIDPPYQNVCPNEYLKGCRPDQIDFEHLGKWCRSRKGQVIVCEYAGAQWLPFKTITRFNRVKGQHKDSKEVCWYRTDRADGLWR